MGILLHSVLFFIGSLNFHVDKVNFFHLMLTQSTLNGTKKGKKMKCHKCQQTIRQEEQHEHAGNILCEDCYIDVLSPTRFCDPWADYSAKSFEKHGTKNTLTEPQEILLHLIKEIGKASPMDLIERLQGRITPSEGERECATLLRLGKIKIKNIEGETFICAL